MTATLIPNIEAFRAFLRTRTPVKRRVTGVTAVTSTISGVCQLQGLVTLVTGSQADNGNDEAELLERQAFAEIDGHIPPVFSRGFAALQLTCPEGRAVEEWRTAIDDAGRFLDSHGPGAVALGWQASDLFGAGGLAWSVRGATVVVLTSSMATLSDGRTFKRVVSESRL